MGERSKGKSAGEAETLQGVFVGNFLHTLDPKRRLTIPSQWREQVGCPEQVYVLPGIDLPCLSVFPAREMARRLERIRGLSIGDGKGRNFMRTLASRSELLPWDAQGRIRVKDELLDYAGLKSDVVLIGAFECFELWSPEKWKLHQESSDTSTSWGEAARYVGF
jgi:MraZ protein